MGRNSWLKDVFSPSYLAVLAIGIFSLAIVLDWLPILWFTRRSFFLFPLAFSLSYCFTPLAAMAAERLGVIDVPNERKVHSTATPLLGGVPIFMAFVLATAMTFWYSFELKGVVWAAAVIFMCGLLDDVFGLSSVLRLGIQLASVFVLFYYGLEVDFVPDPTVFHIVEKVVTVLWVIGIMNSVNFLDGLDGLCVGFGAIASLVVGFIAYLTHQFFLMFLALSLAGACSGFLPYNFRKEGPARIFMGSAGSLFIGFTLAALAIMGNWAENRVVALMVPVLVLFLPIFDTSMTTYFRFKDGKVRTVREWLDYVGKDHLHHRVYAAGIGKRNAVYVLWMITILLGISAVIIRIGGALEAYLALAQAATVLVFFLAFTVYTKKKNDAVMHVSGEITERSQNGPRSDISSM